VGKAAKDRNGKRLPFYRCVWQQSQLLVVIIRTIAWQCRYFNIHVSKRKS